MDCGHLNNSEGLRDNREVVLPRTRNSAPDHEELRAARRRLSPG
jgi:hypothetical protein